jgi:rhodanese-related sulfurtransferase
MLCLVPQAGTALVPSQHPIVSIWQAHREPTAAEAGADASLDESADETADQGFATVREAFAQQRAEPALVWRSGLRVQVAALGLAEAAFTARVLRGETLGAALQATAAAAQAGVVPGLDLEHWLLLQLQRGWLAGVGPPVAPLLQPPPHQGQGR